MAHPSHWQQNARRRIAHPVTGGVVRAGGEGGGASRGFLSFDSVMPPLRRSQSRDVGRADAPSIRRMQLFEFTDLRRGRTVPPAADRLRFDGVELLDRSGPRSCCSRRQAVPNRVVDLCSSGAGPGARCLANCVSQPASQCS